MLKKVTLNKHIDSKHQGMNCDAKLCNSKCSLCEDTLKTKDIFKLHNKDHMDEIEVLDITTLTNNHEVIVCNLCNFESVV